MTKVPDDVTALVSEREEARAAGDYARADLLRDRIRDAGFIVRDTPEGAVLDPAPAFERVDPGAIVSTLDAPASCRFSFHVLDEGFAGDLTRFCDGLAAHNDLSDAEVVIVDNGGTDGERIEDVVAAHPPARALHLDRPVGWAAARNAGLRTARGAIIVVADLSIEPTGDLLTPLADAFDDPEVGVAGPFGLVTHDLYGFEPAPGPRAHAIEGYLQVLRRTALAQGQFREKFTWYRNADIDLSFQVRAAGFEARVVPLPVTKHEHRGWAALDEVERDRRSRKNHAAFLSRWRDRQDLIS